VSGRGYVADAAGTAAAVSSGVEKNIGDHNRSERYRPLSITTSIYSDFDRFFISTHQFIAMSIVFYRHIML